MTGTAETSTKRKQRIENKKKKMAALLDIVKLNENDRQKVKNSKSEVPESIGDCERVSGDASEDIGHSPNKKMKTESDFEIIAVGPSGKPKLEGVELAELKRILRERTNKIRQVPKFWLRDMGENANLKVALDNRCPLFLSDIQHLLMFSQIGVHSPYSPGRWCGLEKYNRLSHVTLLILENVSLYHYEAFESHFPFTSSHFDHKLELISPYTFNSDVVKELSMVPLSATQLRRLVTEHGSLEEAAKKCSEVFDTLNHFFPIDQNDPEDGHVSGSDGTSLPTNDKYSRTKLLLSGWQMIEENFPLPIKGLVERKYIDYILTKDSYKSVSAHSPLIALDCEMCKTTTGELELTRISVVNEQHEILYDSLVKPENKIVDYLTRFSGINAKIMKHVTTNLRDVQEELRQILPQDAILIGQSLSNDLHALKMMHPYVIDTSVIYNITGERCRKTKLQTLAREFLKEKIQVGTQGHCSSEDSLACMKLVQLKLKHHLFYGDSVMNSPYNTQRAYPEMGSANYATSMLKQCVKVGNTVNLVAVDDLPDQYKYYVDKNSSEDVPKNITFARMDSNKDVVRHLCETMNSHNLNIGHLRIAQDQLQDEHAKAFKLLDKWIGEMYAKAAQPAILAVLLGGNKEGGSGACFLHLKKDFVP